MDFARSESSSLAAVLEAPDVVKTPVQASVNISCKPKGQ